MTTNCTRESSVVDWVIEHPETQSVLESLGIDCSCAGKSLAYACEQQRLSTDEVLIRLHGCIPGGSEASGPEAGRRSEWGWDADIPDASQRNNELHLPQHPIEHGI